MWTEVLAVLIIALANVVCYITHEKSLLHGHLNLPKVLFISNRAPCSSPRSRTYWSFDVLEPLHVVTSHWLSDTGLLLLRCVQLLFFAVTLTLEGTTGDGFGDRPKTWWTYFTNWTFILFALWSLLGVIVTAKHVQAKASACDQHQALEAQEARRGAGRDASAAGPGSMDWRWTPLLKTYCIASETNAVSTLFLSAFFWAFLSGEPGAMAVDNILKHGVNNGFILLDIFFSKQPFVSYHFQVTLWYGSLYLVFMFIYYGASSEWVYWVLDWDRPSALVLYALLPLLLFAAFCVWYWIALLREAVCKRLPLPQNRCFVLANSALLPAAYATDGMMSLECTESQRLTDSPQLQQRRAWENSPEREFVAPTRSQSSAV
ncbi:hypothetical protein CVIRNUC_002486 [Coccomyxa viridis]|uniref:Uncharacterized protein n=1 Tax=Coccomyxa viridis TaxID=1274662 RepID=A0AAV1I080_9CHLO|nr:hypothetical protein CVIRNUC_002486 [Coccomyxa viridis]